jgi:hypothetical protein
MSFMKSLCSLFLFALVLHLPASLRAQDIGVIPGDVLVMLTPNGSADKIAEDLRSIDGVATGLRVEREVSAPMRIWLLKFDHNAVAQERMLARVQGHPHVMMAQNDHPVTFRSLPNDPQYGDQWHHQNIDSELAWAISTGGVTITGDTIVVCIIEGANLLHPDLIENRWLNHFEIPGNGIDDDGNGYVDDHRGWNPGGNNDVVYSGAHGTNVAGMIGARGDNNLGMVGANWNVKMMVVTVGSLSQANVIASYTYPLVMRRLYNETAGEKGAFVVATNASWGIDNANPASYPLWCAVYDTLGTAGILNCGATANNNVNVDVVGDMPTACSSDFMVSVTATNNNDQRTFSGYGLTTIDVGAPGANVFTTNGTNGYTSTSGTSFASPLTAGVIGLLYSAPCPSLMGLAQSDPMAAALYVRQMLFNGVDIVGNLPGQTVTGGRINAGTSMAMLMAACSSCPAPYAPALAIQGSNALMFSWSAFGGSPYTVRHRPVGANTWTLVEGVDELQLLVTGLDLCVPHEFQVGGACDEGDPEFSVPMVYQPVIGVTPTVAVSAFPVICAGQTVQLTSSSATGNVWSTGQNSQSIQVGSTGTYTVTVTGPCDVITSAAVNVEVLDPALPDTDPLVMLPGPGTATLTATGNELNWYTTPVGGVPVGSGSPWETPFLEQSTSFWLGNSITNEFELSYGGPEDRSTVGQYHTNASFWLNFTAYEPFIIRSVKVFANGAGERPIGLINAATGSTVVQGSFALPDGESRVQLNMAVPAAGEYALRIMSGNPQLWRDGIGSNPAYPFALGTMGAITSSNATGSNATSLYYFFYDWELEPQTTTCESERVEVLVSMPVGIADRDALGHSVYPVPANEMLYIEAPEAQGLITVHVLDNSGRLVLQAGMQGGRAAVDVRSLAAGPYIFRLVDNETEITRGRFVVAH